MAGEIRCTVIAGVLTALLVTAVLPVRGHAQSWKPDKALEIIVGTTPGGPQDRTGRLVQRLMQERKLVDQPITVINKAGGGGAVGMTYLAQHAADPHYMMIVAQTLISNHVTGRGKLTYTDFTPLAVLGVEYVCIVVRPDSPLTNARDLVERLRKDPASLSMAIGTSLGNATHSSVAHALKTAGVEIRKMRAVVFNSGGESLAAVMGGHVDAAAGSISTVLAQVRAGRVRVIVVGAPRRWVGEFAAVPTWKEIGIDSAQDLWRGLAAPKGLSAAQVAYWDATLGRMVKEDDWRKDLDNNLMDNVYKNSADTFKHWQTEYGEVKALFVEMGLVK
jgi:putative tricarboxylic transport membrane protein